MFCDVGFEEMRLESATEPVPAVEASRGGAVLAQPDERRGADPRAVGETWVPRHVADQNRVAVAFGHGPPLQDGCGGQFRRRRPFAPAEPLEVGSRAVEAPLSGCRRQHQRIGGINRLGGLAEVQHGAIDEPGGVRREIERGDGPAPKGPAVARTDEDGLVGIIGLDAPVVDEGKLGHGDFRVKAGGCTPSGDHD